MSYVLKHYKQFAIPWECRQLTFKSGLMRKWLESERYYMSASVLTINSEVVAWCTYVLVAGDIYKTGTFVKVEHRRKNYAQLVITHAMEKLKEENNVAIVRYGSPIHKFNPVYRELIEKAGLVSMFFY